MSTIKFSGLFHFEHRYLYKTKTKSFARKSTAENLRFFLVPRTVFAQMKYTEKLSDEMEMNRFFFWFPSEVCLSVAYSVFKIDTNIWSFRKCIGRENKLLAGFFQTCMYFVFCSQDR